MNSTIKNQGPVTPVQRKLDLQRSMRLCTAEGFVAMPIVTMALPVNVFITALVAKTYILPKPMIGLMSAMPFIGNFLQIFLTPFLLRWRPAKTVSILFAGLHMLSWVALAFLLPYIPKPDPAAAGRWLIIWFFLSSMLISVSAVAWNSWVQEWVPARLRGKFFGRRNRLLQTSTLAFLLGAGWVLARWQYAVPAFQAIVIGAVCMRCFSLRWSWSMPTRSLHLDPPVRLTLVDQFRVLRQSRSFLHFVAFGAVWAFATNCFGPFYHVFMFEQLDFSAFNVGLLATLSAFGGALSLPAWGRLLDRYGNKPVMTLSLMLWQGQSLLWCILRTENRSLLYPMWFWAGMMSAGFVLGQFTILLKLIPTEAKNLAIGMNLALTALVAAVAPIIGGVVLQWALAHWTDALSVYHACFLLQPVLALSGVLLLVRVHETHASDFTSVVGAMRNIRTLSGVLGLDFLVNYVFYRPQKDGPPTSR